MTDLRAFIFIDQLQPQTLAYTATWMRGTLPRARMAAQIIEIAPGLDVERDVIGAMAFRPAVSPALRSMDAALFADAPMGLAARLKPRPARANADRLP